MDSLKTLLDKKEYDLILRLTEASTDESGLFYRLSALVCLARYQDALKLIEEHRDVYEQNMINLLKLHFEILFELGLFDKAYIELKHYQDCPYVSQEVEEYLALLPKLIRSAEKGQDFSKIQTSDELNNILRNSHDDYELLLALDKIKALDRSPYLASLIKLCEDETNSVHPYVRTYALLELVDIKYPNSVNFNKNKKIIKVIPKDLYIPYVGETYDNFIKELAITCRNPSLSNVATNMLNEYIMYSYPNDVFGQNDKLLSLVFIALADSYFSSNTDIDYLCKERGIDADLLNKEKKNIEKQLASVTPLKI